MRPGLSQEGKGVSNGANGGGEESQQRNGAELKSSTVSHGIMASFKRRGAFETKKYHIINFGCQMNERDAETLAGICEGLGYVPGDAPEDAELILVNTCCVRETAQDRALGRIGELKRLKDRRPSLVIGVGGCMVEQPHVRQQLQDGAHHVNLLFGTRDLDRLPQLLVEAGVVPARRSAGRPLGVRRKSSFRALVNISRGCDNRCTYCIVPAVRGGLVSRPPGEILTEVAGLVANGYVDITLLGQNVTAYGHDRPDYPSLATLLRQVGELGARRLRFLTSHPRDFSRELVEALAGVRGLCEHVHLPVQSGSDRILAAMGRGYTAERYLELLDEIRQALPGVVITTDSIVGFPGETEADFSATYALFQQARFAAAFTFMYSPRQGTVAAGWDLQVPLEVRKKRLGRLIELQNGLSLAVNQTEVGKTVEVLVEGPSRKDKRLALGRTRTNRTVLFVEERPEPGRFKWVRITGASPFNFHGEQLGDA